MTYAEKFAIYYDVERIQELVDSGETYIIIDTYYSFKQNLSVNNIEASDAMDEISDVYDLPYLSVSDYNDLVIDLYEY